MKQSFSQIGFIGMGVMGEPMCRNLAVKSGVSVVGFDRDDAPMQRLKAQGVKAASSVREVVSGSDVVFLSLPSGEVVADVARAADGLLAAVKPGTIIVDLSTSAVDTTRTLAREFSERGAVFIDAPVARTRAAAEAGTLSVMVGGDKAVFDKVHPLIATFASEITLCGPIGSGQVLKILNNMILFQIGQVIAEAKVIGERAGVDPVLLFDTLSKGSADSFALRNHGMKAMLPGDFPERAFSVLYARKDLAYGLRLAEEAGIDSKRSRDVDELFAQAIESQLGEQYWPVISQLIEAQALAIKKVH